MKAIDMARKTDDQGEGRDQRARTGTKTAPARPVKKAEVRSRAPRKAEAPRLPVAAWAAAAREYLREVAYELRKVVWPSRKETMASTAVVVVLVILCGIYLGIVDFILNRFVRLLIG